MSVSFKRTNGRSLSRTRGQSPYQFLSGDIPLFLVPLSWPLYWTQDGVESRLRPCLYYLLVNSPSWALVAEGMQEITRKTKAPPRLSLSPRYNTRAAAEESSWPYMAVLGVLRRSSSHGNRPAVSGYCRCQGESGRRRHTKPRLPTCTVPNFLMLFTYLKHTPCC